MKYYTPFAVVTILFVEVAKADADFGVDDPSKSSRFESKKNGAKGKNKSSCKFGDSLRNMMIQ